MIPAFNELILWPKKNLDSIIYKWKIFAMKNKTFSNFVVGAKMGGQFYLDQKPA